MLSPSEMKLEDGEQAEFVCCSAGLTAVLTQSGKVYALGLNRWGQCGIGSDTPHHLYELSRVKLPEALNFSSIKLGKFGEQPCCRSLWLGLLMDKNRLAACAGAD
jgi:alpha-tubulin suppressor-like RCC1 family protein